MVSQSRNLNVAIALVVFALSVATPARAQAYLGFDRNDYPGDANLKTLRQTFVYAGYWLNNPPGANSNSWNGHRAAVESAGFGFLVLFNGRLYKELKNEANAQRMGKTDALVAVSSARRDDCGSFRETGRLPSSRGHLS